MWITFKRHESYGQRDQIEGPPKFTDIVVFDDELEAMRYAVNRGLKCQQIQIGVPLYKPLPSMEG